LKMLYNKLLLTTKEHNMEETQLELFQSTKQELKDSVQRIANNWPGYEDRYDEDAFFKDIDNGTITSEKQINDIFMAARALWL